MPARVIAFVDHEIGWRLLAKLIALSRKGAIELVAAVTTEENGTTWWPGVQDLCAQAGLRLIRFGTSVHRLHEHEDIDWYLLLSWKHLMSPCLLGLPRKGVINLHYSLLPAYRGVYPVNWAIAEGATKTGVSYHLVDERIDAGDVLCQAEAPILANDTARTLQLRLDDLAEGLFDDLMDFVAEDRQIEPLPQGAGSYRSRKQFNALRHIELDRAYSGKEMLDLLRGLTFAGARNAYFIDPASGRRMYVSVQIDPES